MDSTEKRNIGEESVNKVACHSFLEARLYPNPKDEHRDKTEQEEPIRKDAELLSGFKNCQEFPKPAQQRSKTLKLKA
jgi:hypothetical protein